MRHLPTPIGILASTDAQALDVLAACRKENIDVPRCVAVLGVGNDEVSCELALPTLSSIDLSTQRIGYEAARTLDRLMSGEKSTQKLLLVPPAGIVVRESSDIPAVVDPDIAAAIRYISLHVQDHLQVADLLREVPMSRRALELRFFKALGRTPGAEIRRAQVEAAKQVLTETNEPMARVAMVAGFNSAKQLGVTFLRETGMTPTAHRRRSRAQDQRNTASASKAVSLPEEVERQDVDCLGPAAAEGSVGGVKLTLTGPDAFSRQPTKPTPADRILRAAEQGSMWESYDTRT